MIFPHAESNCIRVMGLPLTLTVATRAHTHTEEIFFTPIQEKKKHFSFSAISFPLHVLREE